LFGASQPAVATTTTPTLFGASAGTVSTGAAKPAAVGATTGFTGTTC
jgi:hypothetical protein